MKAFKLTCILLLLATSTVFAQRKYKKPIFKSCENTPVQQLDACFEEMLAKHVSENLMYPKQAVRDDVEGTVEVQFEVDKEGKIDDIKTDKYAHLYLRAEAERIISLLPTFIYSQENRRPKKQTFSVNIVFKISDIPKKEEPIFMPVTERPKIDTNDTDKEFLFTSVEEKPIFPGCEGLDNHERELCFQQKLAEHIGKLFKYPDIAKKYGIQGRVFVQFIVDIDASIIDIRVIKGMHALLDMEAERMVKSLPNLVQPAIQRGQPVKMAFTVPIVFKLQ